MNIIYISQFPIKKYLINLFNLISYLIKNLFIINIFIILFLFKYQKIVPYIQLLNQNEKYKLHYYVLISYNFFLLTEYLLKE